MASETSFQAGHSGKVSSLRETKKPEEWVLRLRTVVLKVYSLATSTGTTRILRLALFTNVIALKHSDVTTLL